MAYNPYFPASYQPIYQVPQNAPNFAQNAAQMQGSNFTPPQTQAQQNANNGLVWVQGVEGAKAHFVPAGASAMLMDSEAERFYIKTTDASGMPLPLRVFEFKELKEGTQTAPTIDYVRRDEFDELRKSVEALTVSRKEDDNG